MKIIDKYLSDYRNAFKLILSLTLLRLVYIAFIPITPQEAYYWYYAQHPALSYFDHPPVAAYSIWLGTTLFGDNFFGVKFMAVVWSALTMLLLYRTAFDFAEHFAKENNSKTIASLAVLVYVFSIFAHIYSVTLVPDTPLLFFWLLTIYFVQKKIIAQKPKYWLYAGISLGFGLTSKYTAIVLLGSIFFFILFSNEHRKELLTPYPYFATVLAFLVFSPVIYWNAQHGWASFLFQTANRAKHDTHPVQTKYIIQLFFSQLFMLTPLLFVLYSKAIFRIIKRWKENEKFHLLFWSAIVIIAGFTLVSLTSLVKMNWLLPGYLSLAIIVSVMFFNNFIAPGKWMKSGIYFSVFLITVAYAIMLVPNIPLGEGNTWSGWEDAAQKIRQLQEEKGGKGKVFLFSNSYKSASLLKFYLHDESQETYSANIFGEPGLQFSIWGIPDSLKGKDAIYVFTDRREYKPQLKKVAKYFDNLTKLAELEYKFADKIHTRTIYCYYAENYKGNNIR